MPSPRRKPMSYGIPPRDLTDIPPLEEDGDPEDSLDQVPEITTTPGFEAQTDSSPGGDELPPGDVAPESPKAKPEAGKELDEPPPV